MGWGPFSYQHIAKGLYQKFEKMSSLSGGAMTEERAEEIAEAMPYDVLRTYVLRLFLNWGWVSYNPATPRLL